MDPYKDYAREKFEPTSLVDRFGSERNIDATPYVELYRRGEVEWVDPQESIHLDTLSNVRPEAGHIGQNARPPSSQSDASGRVNSGYLTQNFNGIAGRLR